MSQRSAKILQVLVDLQKIRKATLIYTHHRIVFFDVLDDLTIEQYF